VFEPISCDDGDPCTIDSCDPVDGCVHTPIAGCGVCSEAHCGPGRACQGGRCCGQFGAACVLGSLNSVCCDGFVCAAGECQVDPCPGLPSVGHFVSCPGGVCCDEVCSPTCGQCKALQSSDCLPVIAGPPLCCVRDAVCDVIRSGCGLDDDLRCCLPEGGLCTGTCDCCGDLACVGGVCQVDTCAGLDCDDNDPCTTDTCDASGTCVHTSRADGAACVGRSGVCCGGACRECCTDDQCDDGDLCTEDRCDGGTCVHTPLETCGACLPAAAPCIFDGQCCSHLCHQGTGPYPRQCCAQRGDACVFSRGC
jgi:hypothetical protein